MLPQWLSGKEPARSAGDEGDPGLIPGSGRSPRGGNGNPLQYSYQDNLMDRGAWRAIQSMGLQRVGHACVTEQGRMVRAGGEQ